MMKKSSILAAFILISAVFTVPAWEVGTSVHLTNLGFHKNRTSDILTFSGLDFPWGVDAYLNHAVTDKIGINAGYYMDPILRNSVYTLFTFKESFLNLSVGPFFGLFNARNALLKAGISTSIKLSFPGIIFLQFRTDSSIGGRLIQEGDYLQERNVATLGFYVPFAICSIGLHTKKYTEKVADGERIDTQYIYSFTTDIYKKNVPYKVIVNFAFHQLSKTFIEAAGTTVHTLNSLVAGFQVDIFASEVITLQLGLDSSIYTFGTNALLGISNPGPGGYLFDARAGVNINIDSIIARRNL